MSEKRENVTLLYYGDGHGSTRTLTDSSQVATDSSVFDGFGLSVAKTGTFGSPFGYGSMWGYQSDGNGVMRLGHRYYDASTGRFLSRDPIHDGYNWYTYCDNDPINCVDPQGLQGGKGKGGKGNGWKFPSLPKIPNPFEKLEKTAEQLRKSIEAALPIEVVIDKGSKIYHHDYTKEVVKDGKGSTTTKVKKTFKQEIKRESIIRIGKDQNKP